MKLIVGLGNPGREYLTTRHNVGFMLIDLLAATLEINVTEKKFQALIGQGRVNGEKVVLVKPQTYMNLSGEATGALLRWFKLTAEDLLVVYDDLDLPCGKLRLRPGGGTGGHRGLESIILALDTDQFVRLRIGIGRPAVANFEAKHYVLSQFGSDEVTIMKETLTTAVDALICTVREGIQPAMNLYNRK